MISIYQRTDDNEYSHKSEYSHKKPSTHISLVFLHDHILRYEQIQHTVEK